MRGWAALVKTTVRSSFRNRPALIFTLLIPLFLVALLLVRGLPAIFYKPLVGGRRAMIAGLFQATSLTFIVAASQIGTQLGLIRQATAAALIVAGLLSVVIFPLVALTMLRRAEGSFTPVTANERK